MDIGKWVWSGAIGLLALGLAGGGLAWACTQQARIMTLTPAFGPKGQPVSVTGNLVRPRSQIEMRWNGLTGPTLATVIADEAGNFTGSAIIPETAPGIYMILVSTEGFGVARTAFEVTGSAATAANGPARILDSTSQQLWSGFSSGTDPAELSAGSSPERGDSGPGPAVGLGLMAAATVALGSLAVTRVTRKRPL